jgi:hypothetical protein
LRHPMEEHFLSTLRMSIYKRCVAQMNYLSLADLGFPLQVSVHTIDYSFTQAAPRDKESFGLDTGGRMMLVAADKLATFAETISRAYAAST